MKKYISARKEGSRGEREGERERGAERERERGVGEGREAPDWTLGSSINITAACRLLSGHSGPAPLPAPPLPLPQAPGSRFQPPKLCSHSFPCQERPLCWLSLALSWEGRTQGAAGGGLWALGLEKPGFQPFLCHLPARYLISLRLSS